MTIIVFLVDTSASMNQRAYLGGRPTLLDVAKNAVETFVKIRQRSQESRGDRYMLLTFEEPPSNIKAGWKENLATFYCELKNLQGSGMTTLGAALKNTFDVLNINRMQSGIDTYGQGRCPYYLEPSMLVVITDGGRLSTMSGIQEELNLPLQNPMPGSELTKEPFRWDQRLFSLVLRMAGTPPLERDPLSLVPNDHSPIDAMCEVTGGRSYAITSHRMLMQCIDSLVQKVQSGVVLNFEKIGPDPPTVNDAFRLERTDGSNLPDIIDCDLKISDKENLLNSANENDCFKDATLRHSVTQNGSLNSHPHTPSPVINANNTSWHCCRKLIYVPRASQKSFAVGFWPIPESFWPDLNAPTLPPRNAHPNVKFSCTSQEPMVIDNLPFDKYELEPSPLTQYILSRRQPNVCWQVFISNSYKTPDVSHPFGYLKASTNLQCVNLFVLPYNYPVLLPLLDDLFKVQRCKPSKDWKLQFDNYIRNMPSYYAGPLRKALQKMGAPNLVPENLENCLSYSVLNYLKRVKSQAKQEYERMCSEVGKVKNSIPDGIKVTPIHPLTKEVTTHPCLKDKFKHMKDQLNEFNGFLVRISDKELPTQSFRNPFDIPRKNLLDQIARMRANFLQPISRTRFQDEDQLHNLPVGQMGNYQDYLKRMQPPLREIESLPVRQHMFGNPFKIDKNSRMMVDETDIDLVGLKGNKRTIVDNIPLPTRLNKRKPGPLPWDITIRRPITPNTCASVSSPVDSSTLPNLDISVTQSNICDTKSLDAIHMDSDSGDEDSDVLEIDIDSCELVDDSSDKCEDDPVTNHMEEASVPIMMISQGVKQEFNPSSNNLLDLVPVDYSCSLPSSRSEPEYDPHEIKEHNKVIKRSIFKQIRKPGKNFKPLFVLLDDIQGPVEVRSRLVSDVISEANRFKRKQLVVLLEGFMSSLSVKETCYNHRNNMTNGPS